MGQDTREIRNEVEQAREQLGDTVEALAYKVNAPRRIKESWSAKVQRVRERVTSDPRTAKVRDGVETVKEGAGTMKSGVEETVKDGVETVKDTVAQHRDGGPEGSADARR
jgi:Protein of unknown function (DUF3618)